MKPEISIKKPQIANERKAMADLSKLFKMKGVGFIFLAFAAGIILLLLPSEKKEAEANVKESYVEILEENLKSILESATGRKCSVMITVDGGFSYSYAANDKLITSYNESGIASKNVSREYVITTKNGDESLVVLREIPPDVVGVAVVCKNGDEKDKEEIISIICALFDIPKSNALCVVG